MRSSYLTNNFGELLENYVKVWQPANAVELGVLDGYSTLHIARAIKWLFTWRGYQVPFDAYDLFEEYEFKHGREEEVRQVLSEAGVADFVNLRKGNAYGVHVNYPDMQPDAVRGIEFMHIDISNTGDVIRDIMELWHPKIGQRGIVCIEGGSAERDRVEWMTKYNKPGIRHEIETNPIINKYYFYGTYEKFPSMTVLLKKWNPSQWA